MALYGVTENKSCRGTIKCNSFDEGQNHNQLPYYQRNDTKKSEEIMSSDESNSPIQINYDYQNAQRFPAWMALSVFSAICLAAVNAQQQITGRNKADKWVLSVTIVSMILSFCSVLAYLCIRHLYVANIPEMALVRLIEDSFINVSCCRHCRLYYLAMKFEREMMESIALCREQDVFF